MVESLATINNKKGIHVRPSGLIFKEIMTYTGEIIVNKDGIKTPIKDIISILVLGLACNDKITISVNGPNENEMLSTLVELFERNFEFEEM